jgi:hypothetical protein
MNRLRIALSGIVLIAFVAFAFSACGDDDDDVAGSPTATQVETGSQTASATDAEEQVSEAVDDVFVAIRDTQRDRLRDLTGEGLRDRARDQDFDRLMECVPDDAEIELISREVQVSGDTATVIVTFEITQDGEASEVERIWEFERADDGTWLLTEFPECPFD